MKHEVYVHYSNSSKNGDEVTDYSNVCPICHFEMEPNVIISARNLQNDDDAGIYSIMGCTHCHKVFYSEYHPETGIFNSYPTTITQPKHTETITDSFPLYVKLYYESFCAEQYKLHNIVGPSYRKALEFLVKEFCILHNPDKIDEIEKSFLGNCIKNYISDSRIKALAERATWLGNDETHYKKLFADKDIQDLKNLIHLTETFISYDIEAEKAINEIQPK